jgi:hypothetical protein
MILTPRALSKYVQQPPPLSGHNSLPPSPRQRIYHQTTSPADPHPLNPQYLPTSPGADSDKHKRLDLSPGGKCQR